MGSSTTQCWVVIQKKIQSTIFENQICIEVRSLRCGGDFWPYNTVLSEMMIINDENALNYAIIF